MMIQASITGKGTNGEPLYTVNINNDLIIHHLPWETVVLTIHNWTESMAAKPKEIENV